MSQTAAFDYIRSGQIPFFRLPQVAADFEGFRAVLLGVPWDSGTTHQPGAGFAPSPMRRVSAPL